MTDRGGELEREVQALDGVPSPNRQKTQAAQAPRQVLRTKTSRQRSADLPLRTKRISEASGSAKINFLSGYCMGAVRQTAGGRSTSKTRSTDWRERFSKKAN